MIQINFGLGSQVKMFRQSLKRCIILACQYGTASWVDDLGERKSDARGMISKTIATMEGDGASKDSTQPIPIVEATSEGCFMKKLHDLKPQCLALIGRDIKFLLLVAVSGRKVSRAASPCKYKQSRNW